MNNVVIGDLHLLNEERFDFVHRDFFIWLHDTFEEGSVLHFEGDILDSRKSVSNYIVRKIVDVFDFLEEKFAINIVIGNHDICTTHSMENVNVLNKLFRHNKKIKIYSEPTIVGNILYVPYSYDRTEVAEMLVDKIVIGHLEVEELYDSEFSVPVSFFNQSKYTFSGHYHIPRIKGKVNYTGTPIELSHNPNGIECERGVWVFDEENFNPKFILYPEYSKYVSFTVKEIEDLKKIHVKDKNIRIYIDRADLNQIKNEFYKELKAIEKTNKVKINIIDSNIDTSVSQKINLFSDEDIKEIIFKFVDTKYKQSDKESLKKYTNLVLKEFSLNKAEG